MAVIDARLLMKEGRYSALLDLGDDGSPMELLQLLKDTPMRMHRWYHGTSRRFSSDQTERADDVRADGS